MMRLLKKGCKKTGRHLWLPAGRNFFVGFYKEISAPYGNAKNKIESLGKSPLYRATVLLT
jgi:hypothetical protein